MVLIAGIPPYRDKSDLNCFFDLGFVLFAGCVFKCRKMEKSGRIWKKKEVLCVLYCFLGWGCCVCRLRHFLTFINYNFHREIRLDGIFHAKSFQFVPSCFFGSDCDFYAGCVTISHYASPKVTTRHYAS